MYVFGCDCFLKFPYNKKQRRIIIINPRTCNLFCNKQRTVYRHRKRHCTERTNYYQIRISIIHILTSAKTFFCSCQMQIIALRLLSASTLSSFKFFFSSSIATSLSSSLSSSSSSSSSTSLRRYFLSTASTTSKTQRIIPQQLTTTMTKSNLTDIEDLFHQKHNEAINVGESTYIDPETGFTCFTELIHLKRGKCCGNKCRHCPYGYEKVKGYGPPASSSSSGGGGGGYRRRRNRTTPTATTTTAAKQPTRVLPKAPIAKLRSGDIETAEKMVHEIMTNAEQERQKLQLPKLLNNSNSSSRSRKNRNKKVAVYEEEDKEEEDDLLSTTSSSSTVSSTDTNSDSSSSSSDSDSDSNSSSDNDCDSSDVIEAAKTMMTPTSASAAVVVEETNVTDLPPLSSTTVATPKIITATTTLPTTIPTTTTTKNVPYTRTGDQGTSQLGTGERRSKTDDAFEAMGTVDELCSFVGVAHAQLLQSIKIQKQKKQKLQKHQKQQEAAAAAAVYKRTPTTIIDYGDLSDQLLDIMSRLFDVGSHVAKPPPDANYEFQPNGIGDGFDPEHVDDLEEWINDMTEELPELTSFILPTGSIIAAQLHVARTVCRRAERKLVPLVVDHKICDPNSLQYLNRLSDFFFVASRWINYIEQQDEIEYRLELEYSENSEQRVPIYRSPLLLDDDNDDDDDSDGGKS